jgi:hypothetical protein
MLVAAPSTAGNLVKSLSRCSAPYTVDGRNATASSLLAPPPCPSADATGADADADDEADPPASVDSTPPPLAPLVPMVAI